MSEQIKVCVEHECPKRAITGSEYCGDHTDNEQWISSIQTLILQGEAVSKNALVSEIEADVVLTSYSVLDAEINDCKFEDSTFKDVTFERCSFIQVDMISATFENCIFDNCSFNQIYFIETDLRHCEFKENTFEHCVVSDGCQLDGTQFVFNNLSNTDFSDVTSAARAAFLDCIFTICSFNNSQLQGMKFDGVEFTKTALSFCDFRGSIFGTIHHDFDEVGLAPMGCDFYNSELDADLAALFLDNFNNTKEKQRATFVFNAIERLTAFGHPNYLSELTQFINEFSSYGMVVQLKELVNNHYRELGRIAKDTDNVLMMGSLMNNYAHLPPEIRETSTQLISMGNSAVKKDGFATLEITFQSEGTLSFSAISNLNSLIDQLSRKVTPGAQFDVVGLRKGSLIQTIQGHLPEIFTLGGTIFALTLGTLQVMKSFTDIQKNLLTNKKSKLEIAKLEKESAAEVAQELSLSRADEFLQCLESCDLAVAEITTSLDKVHTDSETQQLVQNLDKHFPVKNLRFEIN